jgi:RHS repeat-associated protein
MQVPAAYTVLDEVWSDYNGDEVYGDYVIAGGAPQSTDAYVPGAWRRVAGVSEYLHGDHLGTLRGTTSGTGAPGASRVFTAFGERVAGPLDRFGYAGAWGYQQHGEFPFLHVGARWYDPGSGRFLQRDPMGIWGGLNVYAYVENGPTSQIDPDGLMSSLYHPEAPLIFADLTVLGYTIGNHVFQKAGQLNIALSRLGPAIQDAIQRGQAYWDPVTQTIRWVAPRFTACSNPWTGVITTFWEGGRVAGRLTPSN